MFVTNLSGIGSYACRVLSVHPHPHRRPPGLRRCRRSGNAADERPAGASTGTRSRRGRSTRQRPDLARPAAAADGLRHRLANRRFLDGVRAKDFTRNQLFDAWARYCPGPKPPAEPAQPVAQPLPRTATCWHGVCDNDAELLAGFPPDRAMRLWTDRFIDYLAAKQGGTHGGRPTCRVRFRCGRLRRNPRQAQHRDRHPAACVLIMDYRLTEKPIGFYNCKPIGFRLQVQGAPPTGARQEWRHGQDQRAGETSECHPRSRRRVRPQGLLRHLHRVDRQARRCRAAVPLPALSGQAGDLRRRLDAEYGRHPAGFRARRRRGGGQRAGPPGHGERLRATDLRAPGNAADADAGIRPRGSRRGTG